MNGSRTAAAGVIALDSVAGADSKVLLVHRPLYDDWTLPKGKVEPDESLPACAVRETLEETGVRVRLEVPIGVIRYPVGGGLKEVHYWRAFVRETIPRRPDAEVDRVVWLSVRTALTRMTYGDERALVDRALALPRSTPVLVVRHAKAMERRHWSGRDQARPITERGRRQSRALVPLLDAYGVTRLESSSSTRCLQTLRPYAKAAHLEVNGWSTLSEEIAERSEKAVGKLMRRLSSSARADDAPTALCGHRPVLPLMLDALGVTPRPMQTAAVAVAHLDAAGATVATEYHKPLV